MAISRFKDIIDNKGYKVTLADRTIFERSVNSTPFGLDSALPNQHNNTDVIEFILFDSNNNQLPQGDGGKLVRYIYLDDARINEYITISRVTDNKHIHSNEYVINAERLIKDAGYSNGIFNVQITLLNRRVGTDLTAEDKLWIHEISPSRTEIRVLPVKGDTDNTVWPDLQERYNLFLKDGEFRDDTIHFVRGFIEQIDISKVLSNMMTSKGKVINGQSYINRIKEEFKIFGFETFLTDIRTKYTEAMIYFVSNCDYNVMSLNYGKPLDRNVSVSLSVAEIYDKAIDIIASVIDKVLVKRDIIKDSIFVEETSVTLDDLEQIAYIADSKKVYNPTKDDKIIHSRPPIPEPDKDDIIYDIPPRPEYRTTTFYVWSDTGGIEYVDKGERLMKIKGVEYDELAITYMGEPKFIGDVRTTPKMKISSLICTDPRAINYGEVGVCRYKKIDIKDSKPKEELVKKLPKDKDITIYKKASEEKSPIIDVERLIGTEPVKSYPEPIPLVNKERETNIQLPTTPLTGFDDESKTTIQISGGGDTK